MNGMAPPVTWGITPSHFSMARIWRIADPYWRRASASMRMASALAWASILESPAGGGPKPLPWGRSPRQPLGYCPGSCRVHFGWKPGRRNGLPLSAMAS